MSVFDLYKPFRNKVAKLSCEDAFYVIWAFAQNLQLERFDIPRDIEVHASFRNHEFPASLVAPWELELLAKEVILNAPAASSHLSGSIRSWETLRAVVNHLKSLENEIYRRFGSKDNVLIEMIRIAHRQFIWQVNRPNAIWMYRYFRIFSRPEIDEISTAALGLTVRDVYFCGTAFIGIYMSSPFARLPVVSSIPQVSGEKIERFLAFASRSLSQLKPILKAEQRYDDSFAYAYNSLRAYPLVRMIWRGHDVTACPLPTLLFWRITGGLYYELVGDPRFSAPFGESFQSYVGEVIDRACVTDRTNVLPEFEYGPPRERKRTVDWIVNEGERAAIFLECKSKRLSWNAKTALVDLRPLETDLSYVADAVVQTYKTIIDYRNNEYPDYPFAADRAIYPVIVTLENWYMMGPEMLNRLRESINAKLLASRISADVVQQMPYSIWAIEELETGLQVVDAVGIEAFLAPKINNAEMINWTLDSYMRSQFAQHQMRTLFDREYHEMFAGLGLYP